MVDAQLERQFGNDVKKLLESIECGISFLEIVWCKSVVGKPRPVFVKGSVQEEARQCTYAGRHTYRKGKATLGARLAKAAAWLYAAVGENPSLAAVRG
jgi:hypothetical protein